MTKTMNKPASKIIALCLALCMMCALSVNAFAAEVDTSGGEGNTPVNLTTTNDGLVDTDGDGIPDTPGTVTPTKMSVVVPTVLPMAMSEDGVVVTADNCKIVNNSYGAVRVKSVTISAASDWNLTKFGDKSILAGEKVDSNKLGFSMSAIIIGIILGSMAEQNFVGSLIMSDGNFNIFFTRPICLFFLVAAALSLLSPVIGKLFKKA